MGHKTNALLKIFGAIAIPFTIAVAGVKHVQDIGTQANDALSGKPPVTERETPKTESQLQIYKEPQ